MAKKNKNNSSRSSSSPPKNQQNRRKNPSRKTRSSQKDVTHKSSERSITISTKKSSTQNDSKSKARNDITCNKQVADGTTEFLLPIEEMDDVTGTEKNDIADALDNIQELESADKLTQVKKKEKTTNAMKHFDFFLLNHFKAKNPNNQVTHHEKVSMKLLEEEDTLFDRLATYFAKRAKKKCLDDQPLLSLNSADNYFSACKIYFIEKYEKEKAEDRLSCFAPRKTKRLRDCVIKLKKATAQIKGEKLFNTIEAASNQDVEALASLCIWQGTERGISFLTLNKILYHLVARCCEGAGLWKQHVTVVKKKMKNGTNNVLCFLVNRHKNNNIQNPCVYCHIDSLLWDVYFSLGIHLMIQTSPNGHIFPDFFNKLGKVAENSDKDSNDSKSSALWNRYYKETMKFMDDYKGELIFLLL